MYTATVFTQGGNRPLTSSFEDSDEDFDQLNMGPDNELEKVSLLLCSLHLDPHVWFIRHSSSTKTASLLVI